MLTSAALSQLRRFTPHAATLARCMVALHDRGYALTEEEWSSTPGKLAKRALEERLTIMTCFAAAH